MQADKGQEKSALITRSIIGSLSIKCIKKNMLRNIDSIDSIGLVND
jgi:hypothetical protein